MIKYNDAQENRIWQAWIVWISSIAAYCGLTKKLNRKCFDYEQNNRRTLFDVLKCYIVLKDITVVLSVVVK